MGVTVQARMEDGVASMTAWWAGLTPAYWHQKPARCCRWSATMADWSSPSVLDQWLIQQFWRQLSPKPWWIRRWCSWQTWRTTWDLQLCQLEQTLDWPGWRDKELQTSHQANCIHWRLRNISKCWTSTQNYLVGHFWVSCDYFHEMTLK